MKKIEKLNREIPYDAYHLRDKINELVDAFNAHIRDYPYAAPEVKEEPPLAERLKKSSYWLPEALAHQVSDEAKKAFEELINESVVLEILRNELISKIRRM